jgi:hypothetical protein
MGQKFYEADVPRIVEALQSIAKEMKRSNDLKDKEREEEADRAKRGYPPKGAKA